MKNPLRNMASQFKWTLLVTLAVLLIFLCLFLVVGCDNDEDTTLEAYQKELCELQTNKEGRAQYLVFDDGTQHAVTNEVKDLTPDSTYRVIAVLVNQGEDKGKNYDVKLGNVSAVFSPFPHTVKDGQKLKTDAVEVLSCWRSDRYINLRVSFLRGNKAAHYMGFIDNGDLHLKNGGKRKTIVFYHDTNGDDLNYKQEMYASCPLYQLDDQLVAGRDSIRFVVKTNKGDYTFDTEY